MNRVVQISAYSFQDQSPQLSYYRAEIVPGEGEQEIIPHSLALIPGMLVEPLFERPIAHQSPVLSKLYQIILPEYYVKAECTLSDEIQSG